MGRETKVCPRCAGAKNRVGTCKACGGAGRTLAEYEDCACPAPILSGTVSSCGRTGCKSNDALRTQPLEVISLTQEGGSTS